MHKIAISISEFLHKYYDKDKILDLSDRQMEEFKQLLAEIIVWRGFLQNKINSIKKICDTYRGLLTPIFFDTITEQIKQQIYNTNIDTHIDGEAIRKLKYVISNIKQLEDYLPDNNLRTLEVLMFKYIALILNDENLTDKDKQNEIFFIEKLAPSKFNHKILHRILFSLNPERMSGYKGYSNNKTITHTQILNKVDGTILMSELKDIIQRSSPAAQRILKRIIFVNKSTNQKFIFDEAMRPMDVNYNALNIPDNNWVGSLTIFTNISPFDSVDEAKQWRLLFDDFQIIPLINYWKHS